MTKETPIIRLPQRADGFANVLAIETANPANCVLQEDYPDWFFRVTQSNHLTHLKAKMKKICANTEINKRYFHHDEDLTRRNPNFLDKTLPSLDARQEIAATTVPELAAAAARKAIDEWGRPASAITHLVFCTFSAGAHMPGADLRLATLLGLRPSVQRTMVYFNGCNSGFVALRLAKDIAENNRGARVLVARAETTLVMFHAPDEDRVDRLVGSALFGDGAGAVIVASDPDDAAASSSDDERLLFEMVSCAQETLPGTEHVMASMLGECGFLHDISRELPSLVATNVERCLVSTLSALGLKCGDDWDDLFWVVHPGGPAVLDGIQESLKLKESKLKASHRVHREYGNMAGVTIIFVLDEMRRRCQQKANQDGEAVGKEECEWGAMVGLGPGVTIETMLLRAIRSN